VPGRRHPGVLRHGDLHAKAWEEGINVLLGIVLLVSPWVLGFATRSEPTSNAVIVGVLVAAIAAWAMLGEQVFRDRLLGRHQTR